MNFAEVEREVAKLRQEFDAGHIIEQQFKARLKELMVEDENGDWWMVGYETGQWYRHDGANWVQANPPGHVPSQLPPPPTDAVGHATLKVSPPPTAPSRPARSYPLSLAKLTESKWHRAWAVFLFIMGLGISAVFGLVAMGITDATLGWAVAMGLTDVSLGWIDLADSIVSLSIGLGCVIYFFIIARRVWRGKR